MTDKYRLTQCTLALFEDDEPHVPSEKVGFYLNAANVEDEHDNELFGIQLTIATKMTGFTIDRLTADDLRKLAVLFMAFAEDHDILRGVEPSGLAITVDS
jgi:hypothetical protein